MSIHAGNEDKVHPWYSRPEVRERAWKRALSGDISPVGPSWLDIGCIDIVGCSILEAHTGMVEWPDVAVLGNASEMCKYEDDVHRAYWKK